MLPGLLISLFYFLFPDASRIILLKVANDFLKHYREYENANKSLVDKLNKLNAGLEGYKLIDYSEMSHGSGEASPDDKLCNMIFERDVTKKYLKENEVKIDGCEKILAGLDEDYKKILTMSYIDELPEIKIMHKLNVSRANYFKKGRNITKLNKAIIWN